jgi:hypothetical protein
MTAELVRGQNHALPGNRLEIRVSAGTPVVVAVTLGDERGRSGADSGVTLSTVPPGTARGEWLAHPGTPNLPGVEVPRQAAADHRLALDLGAMPELVHRVHVLLALPTGRPGAPADFGAAPAPRLAVTTLDGTSAVGFTITGLGAETALLAVELYRRQGTWKVRAVGQGYAGGLPALLLDQGVPEAAAVAGEIHAAVEREQSRSVPLPTRGASAAAGSATGSSAAAASAAGSSAAGAAGSPTGGRGTTPAPTGQGAAPSDAATSPGPAAASAAGAAGPPAVGRGTTPAPTGQAAAPTVRPGTTPAPAPDAPAPTAPDPAAASVREAAPHTASGIDYRHPRRRTAAVPPPPASPLPSAADSVSQAPSSSGPVPPVHGPGGSGAPPVPVAGDAAGWTMEERLHNQIWGMFEDLARSVAAYRSAADFAQSRYEQELDRLLADPRTRGGPAAEAARDEAQFKQVALVDQARAVLDRDLAQLTAEAEVVEPALPPPFAGWENPVWHAYRVPSKAPMAVALGSLTLPEAPELRIPLLARLPLERGLWIDSAGEHQGAMETAVAIAARLLASHPVGGFAVQTLDPAGSGAAAFAPLYAGGALIPPPLDGGAAGGSAAAGRGRVGDVLARLTERVDLLQMAIRGGASDALPPGFDTAEQLLIVNEFPYGFDDWAVTQLRYLVDEGPAAGVHVLLVADREDAEQYGPVLNPLWCSLLRLTPLPSDHLADPWVGHAWTYEPALVPPDSQVLAQVLRQVAAARPAYGHGP